MLGHGLLEATGPCQLERTEGAPPDRKIGASTCTLFGVREVVRGAARRSTRTQHYSVAQIVELHAALEKIKGHSGRWNKSLAMLKREQEDLTGNASPPKVPQQRKTA
jgi:hypothetical protein